MVRSQRTDQRLVARASIGDRPRKPSALASCTTYPPTAPAAPVTARVRPGASASSSRASHAVSPFMGSVAASASVAPAGLRTTDSQAPRRARRTRPAAPGAPRSSHDTMARPGRSVRTPSPICSRSPAASMPGTCRGAMSLEPLGPATAAQHRVGRVHRRSPHPDAYLSGARLGIGQIDQAEDLGTAELRDPHRHTWSASLRVVPACPGALALVEGAMSPSSRLRRGSLPGVYQLRPRPTTDGGIYRSHGSPVQHARRRGRAPLHMVRLGERFPHRHVGGACHLARVIRRSGGDRPLFPARPKRRVDGLSAGAGGRPMAETRAGRRSPGSPGGVAMARVDRRGGGLGRARHRHGHPRGPSDAPARWPRPIGR